ncbi:hypothetical protein LBMAG42_55540 [Deltaproteobacteria bacterium]|nr:hypothetical protein LBMAG42_55540 [Deltaproteobacteria bacterium]
MLTSEYLSKALDDFGPGRPSAIAHASLQTIKRPKHRGIHRTVGARARFDYPPRGGYIQRAVRVDPDRAVARQGGVAHEFHGACFRVELDQLVFAPDSKQREPGPLAILAEFAIIKRCLAPL